MRYMLKLLIISTGLLIQTTNCKALSATSPNIAVSIKPFYNLIAAVTKNTCSIKLIVHGNISPHHYTLKPSDLQILSQADIVFWGGENIEPFLGQIINNYKNNTNIINLSTLPGIDKKPIRKNFTWPNPTNKNNCNHHNNEHIIDPHIWLSIYNANIIVNAIADILSKYEPKNATFYQTNAKVFVKKLAQLDKQLTMKLASIKNTPYVVLHDAYQYFEINYSLKPLGVIMLHPEIPPSIRHLQDIKKLMRVNQIQCIFSEPQLQSSFIKTLTSDTNIKHGILDPIGSDADLGKDGYLMLMENISTNMLGCLQ